MSLWITTACAEVQRLLLNGLATEDVVARPLPLGPAQLLRGHAFGLHAIELRDQLLLHFFGLPARLHDRDRIKEIGVLDELRLAERGQRHLLLVDERAIDPRAVAVRQDLGERCAADTRPGVRRS